MRKEEIIIKKVNGKVPYLSDLIEEIPTNTILHKTLTGLGATYLELKAKRNSVIIEPNVPVIKGKCSAREHKKDNLFGVYKGVQKEDILNYIDNSEGMFLKILTTPESFGRVCNALNEAEIDIRFNCFLLFDECHKIIKDSDFRPNISLPMNLFFECENKAMVSATPIEQSDPRFEVQQFQELSLVPEFDYKQNLSLVTTNNLLQTVKEEFQKVEGNLFIFCNSTDMIYNLMKQMNIIKESAVFCSTNSVNKLHSNKDIKISTAYDNWDKKHMKRYNWMTSRFYNALDIYLDEPPHVFLLTNCYFASWTMFEPATDVVQAIGRFRTGISSVTHIASINTNLQVQTKEEVMGYIKGLRTVHDMIVQHQALETNKVMKTAWGNVVKVSPYNYFLDDNQHDDYFKIDNYVNEEVVKGYYAHKHYLSRAYEATGYFNVELHDRIYIFGDYERLQIENSKIPTKEKLRQIVEQLEMLGPCETDMERTYRKELYEANPFIVEAYDTLGKDVIEELKYRRKSIREAMIRKQYKDTSTGVVVIQLIKNSFNEDTWYPDKYIKDEIKRIFDLLEVKYPKRVTSHTIADFFYCEQKDKNNARGKQLFKCKF